MVEALVMQCSRLELLVRTLNNDKFIAEAKLLKVNAVGPGRRCPGGQGESLVSLVQAQTFLSPLSW